MGNLTDYQGFLVALNVASILVILVMAPFGVIRHGWWNLMVRDHHARTVIFSPGLKVRTPAHAKQLGCCSSRQQAAGSSRQQQAAAGSRRQAAGGSSRQQEACSMQHAAARQQQQHPFGSLLRPSREPFEGRAGGAVHIPPPLTMCVLVALPRQDELGCAALMSVVGIPSR